MTVRAGAAPLCASYCAYTTSWYSLTCPSGRMPGQFSTAAKVLSSSSFPCVVQTVRVLLHCCPDDPA
eukprot:3940549-Amphidinium_carterae.1